MLQLRHQQPLALLGAPPLPDVAQEHRKAGGRRVDAHGHPALEARPQHLKLRRRAAGGGPVDGGVKLLEARPREGPPEAAPQQLVGGCAPQLQRLVIDVGEGQLLIDREERVADAFQDLLHPAVGRLGFRLRPHRRGHVQEGEHGAGDEVVQTAVRQDAHDEPQGPRRVSDLAFHRAQGPQYPPHVRFEVAVDDA